jgi:hypothetical protein
LAGSAFAIFARRIRVFRLHIFVPINYAILLFVKIIQCCIVVFSRLQVF